MMTKEFTFAHEPKGNKLSVTQVNDLCEKNSALIMKRTAAATYSCTDKQDPWREEVRLTSAKFTFFYFGSRIPTPHSQFSLGLQIPSKKENNP